MENDIQKREIKIVETNTATALENITTGAIEGITKNIISETKSLFEKETSDVFLKLTQIAQDVESMDEYSNNQEEVANKVKEVKNLIEKAINTISEDKTIYKTTNKYVEDTIRETIKLALNETKNDILNELPHKIVSEEELKDYLDRFDESYQRVLDITLQKLTQTYNESKITQDVLTKVMIGAIAQSQEIALKMLGVDLQQENTKAQIRSMNQSIIDNRLIKCGDFIGNTIGYAAQGGSAFDSRLWTMLMMVGKEIMISAGMNEEVQTLGNLNDIKKDSK